MLPDTSDDSFAAAIATIGGVIGAALGYFPGMLLGLGIGAVVGGALYTWLNRTKSCWPLPVAGGFAIVGALVATPLLVFCLSLIIAVAGLYTRDAVEADRRRSSLSERR